jgi:hypothetical protein
MHLHRRPTECKAPIRPAPSIDLSKKKGKGKGKGKRSEHFNNIVPTAQGRGAAEAARHYGPECA